MAFVSPIKRSPHERVVGLIMRKLIILLLLCVSTAAFGQIQRYQATSWSFKTNNGYGWTDWSKWMNTNIVVVFDLGNDIIKTYGNDPQTFKVYASGKPYWDGSGTSVEMSCIDQDGLRCGIRLRIESNGNSQIYIDYADVMTVLNVRRIQ